VRDGRETKRKHQVRVPSVIGFFVLGVGPPILGSTASIVGWLRAKAETRYSSAPRGQPVPLLFHHSSSSSTRELAADTVSKRGDCIRGAFSSRLRTLGIHRVCLAQTRSLRQQSLLAAAFATAYLPLLVRVGLQTLQSFAAAHEPA